MISKILSSISVVILLICSGNIYSQSIVTDRPDQTESAVLVPVSSFQIETGVGLGYETINKAKYRSFVGPNTLFRYGINKIIELRITNSFVSFKNISKEIVSNGIADLQVGAKLNLMNSKESKTSIAFLTHVIFPTGSYDFTSNSYGTINKLAFSHSITNSIGMGYNIGYDYFGEGNGNFVYTLSFGFSLGDRIGAFVEGYGHIEDFEDNYSSFDMGFTYLIRNNLQYDFSFGSGINHYMNYISTGISWNIGGY